MDDKTLATTRPGNGRITAQSSTEALIGTLPKWLQYLIGAFPAAQTNTMTYLAYETAFAEIDPALMLAAVQAVAKQHKFSTFPTIAEIDQMVTTLTQRAELEEASEHAARLHIAALAQKRQALLKSAYAGEFDPAGWESLISQYESVGFETNANWVRRKSAQFDGGC